MHLDLDLSDAERRLALAALRGVALSHLLVPGRLLSTASRGYDLALDVSFDPRAGATRRVRLVGCAMLALAEAAARLDG